MQCLNGKNRFENLPPIIIRGFMGTADEAAKYLDRRFYISLTGYLCKASFEISKIQCVLKMLFLQDKSDIGVRKLLENGTLPLDRLLVETDSPFMYPNTRASKLPQHVKTGITERSLIYLHRYLMEFLERSLHCLYFLTLLQILHISS